MCIRDRSKELSEMMMILMNVWVGMYAENREDFLVKVDYYQEFCEKMGIPVIDDRIKEAFICYFDEVIKEQPGCCLLYTSSISRWTPMRSQTHL